MTTMDSTPRAAPGCHGMANSTRFGLHPGSRLRRERRPADSTRAAAFIVALLASLIASAAAQDLASADAAFMQQHFTDAARDFRAVLAGADTTDRRKASLALSEIDWLINADTARAMQDLRPFIATAPALVMASRARLDAHNVRGAISAARAALAAAHDTDERRDATVALASAALDPYERSCIDSTHARPAARDANLTEALGAARASVNAEPGHLDVSDRLVRLAALTGDWSSLNLGWRSYYAVGRRVPGGPLVRAESELDSLAAAAPSRKAAHAYAALVDSKMFEPAALLAACGALASRAPSDSIRETVAYAHFLRDARRVTNAYYRNVALGHPELDVYRGQLDSLGKRLWPHLVRSGSAPAYDLPALERELEKRFDLVTNMGNTGDVVDLHSGHRVSTESRDVTQYGKTAHITFAVLDGMISDGYQTWAWDGRAAHGGWASADEIIQVRDGYAEGPLRAWHALTDSAIVARRAKTIARDSVADIARARSTEIGYFPSLDARLRRDAGQALLDSLRRTGLTGRALELAFVRTIRRRHRRELDLRARGAPRDRQDDPRVRLEREESRVSGEALRARLRPAAQARPRRHPRRKHRRRHSARDRRRAAHARAARLDAAPRISRRALSASASSPHP